MGVHNRHNAVKNNIHGMSKYYCVLWSNQPSFCPVETKENILIKIQLNKQIFMMN